MAFCVELVATADGQMLRAVNPQPATVDSCVMVVVTPGEYLDASAWGGLVNISAADAFQIAQAAGLLFAVAFVWRVLIRFVDRYFSQSVEAL